MTDVAAGTYLESTFAYDPRTREVRFTFPDGFAPSRLYNFQIVNLPKETYQIDQNVTVVNQEIQIDQSAGTATMTTQSVDGTVDMLEVKSIYASQFRTSKYNTFVEKMKNVSFLPVIRLSNEINIFQLTSYLRGDERFEEAELPEFPSSRKFVRAEAVLQGNAWYEDRVHPLVYDGYPLLGWMKVSRQQPDVLGIPPAKDVYFRNVKKNKMSGAEGITLMPPPFTDEFIVYNVGQSVAADFRDMQRHAVNYAIDHREGFTPRLQTLVTQPLPSIRYGTYRLKLSYVIPGIERRTSSYEIELFNRIPDND